VAMVVDAPAYSLPVMSRSKTSGDRIRELRERLKLSFREAAKRTGLSHGTIQQLEKRVGRWDRVEAATLEGLARGYGVALETVQRIAQDKEPAASQVNDLLRDLEPFQVHPDWLIFPVYGSVSAGDEMPEPISGEAAYIPRETLIRKGANPETVRAYKINGNCLTSEEAKTAEKLAAGDYVAIDYEKEYEVGDVVLGWWPEKSTMVIIRYGVDSEDTILYSLKTGRPTVLPSSEQVEIAGPVVWRGG
jgi:transcriptional regulator with XRE-family HTH domain